MYLSYNGHPSQYYDFSSLLTIILYTYKKQDAKRVNAFRDILLQNYSIMLYCPILFWFNDAVCVTFTLINNTYFIRFSIYEYEEIMS